MSRTALLLSDSARDESVLETDIMRFMAVIGIVLWIIFALIKSLPFRQEAPPSSAFEPRIETLAQESTSAPAPRPTPAVSPPAPFVQEQPAPPQIPVQPATESVPDPVQDLQEPALSVPEQAEVREPSLDRSVDQFVAAAPQGVWIEFASREELSTMLARGRVRIFAQARTEGFDLLYEAQAGGGAMRFSSVEDLPESLWIISGGQDREYFIGLLSKNEPSLAAFPNQDILVAFTDQALEERLLDQFDFLGKSGRSGVLSITGNGEFVFRDHASPY